MSTQQKAGDPAIEDKLRLIKQVIESRGWRYNIASEPPDLLFANVRFLAGYRRDWLSGAELITAVKDVVGDASSKLSIRQVVQDAADRLQSPWAPCASAVESGR